MRTGYVTLETTVSGFCGPLSVASRPRYGFSAALLVALVLLTAPAPLMAAGDSAAARCSRGMALHARGRLPEAAAEFRAAIALDPRSDQAHTGLGVVLYAQGKLAAAIGEWKRAVQLNPRNAAAYINLGSALNDQGKSREAIGACRAALKLKPRSAGAHLNLGRALQTQRQTTQAIAEYQAALAIDPVLAPAWLHLGTVHAKVTKNTTEAVRCFRRYLELTPNPPLCTCWVKAYLAKHR